MSSIKNFKGEVDDFGAVLGTTADQREAKDKCNNFNQKLKQYVIRELHNPEDIIVLVWYLKDPMIMLDTSITTELYILDDKDTLMFIIQTEEIKHYVKKSSTLRHNITRLYGIIWGQC